MLKADPYANYAELRPNNASIVWDIDKYKWNDKSWMAQRAKTDTKDKPMNIYEVHLGSWIRKETVKDETGQDLVGSEFYNYRELAPRLAEYVKDMGYTHVELMPVMEHPLDESWGYQVTGYYAPTSRYGAPEDFMYFMDYMHGQGIGVILDWVPAHFPRDAYGMAVFDGTCVYEHMDPRKGSHPHWGTLIYNYGRPGVSNFLIANALFWADKYHADGIRMDAVASMLYLDYGKNDGEWVPNIYGGNENLEAMEFLKHLNSVFKGRKDGTVIIAEESTAWPMITGDPKEGGLGFNYKWNMGWMNDFTNYMRCDPLFRKNNYGELTFSMLYAYSEDFVLVFSHDEVVHGKGSMIGKMPGETLEKKAENLRAAYAFMMGHPGKKLLFMGQEYAQTAEWNEGASLEWELLEYPVHKNMQDYVKALNRLYREHPALYEMDYDPDGFEWINCSYQNESMIIFLRKSRKSEETLLFICNFDNMEHEKFRVGVPFHGKYKEIFNTDAKDFGGEGRVNGRVKTSRKLEWDEKDDSIEVYIPPMSVSIYTCTQAAETVKPDGKKSGAKKTADKKPAAGKTAVRKTVSGKTDGKAETAAPETAAAAQESGGAAAVKGGQRQMTAPKEEQMQIHTSKKKPEQKRIATSKEEQKQIGTSKEEQKQIATSKEEQKQIATSRKKQEQIGASKEEQKQIGTSRKKQEQIATSKEEQKQIGTSRKKQEQIATSKEEQKQIGTSKEEQKQIATSRKEQKQIGTSRKRQEQIGTSKEEHKQISTSKKSRKQIGTAKKDQKQITASKPEGSETK